MRTRKNLVRLLVFITLTTLMSSCVHRKPEADRSKKAVTKKEFNFAAYDSNADGRLSKEEAEAAYARSFGRLDKDGDSFLTAAELGPERKLEHLDTDKDERISIIEFMRGFDSRFAEADRNMDKHLNREEAAEFGVPN